MKKKKLLSFIVGILIKGLTDAAAVAVEQYFKSKQ